MELELKHIAPYLPYGLKIKSGNYTLRNLVIEVDNYSSSHNEVSLKNVVSGIGHKPILRPLSDLTKEIEHNGERFVPIFEIYNIVNNISHVQRKKLKAVLNKDLNGKYVSKAILDFKGKFNAIYIKHNEVLKCSYEVIQKLLEWHFDIFSLLENNLAIDINTLKP